MVIMDNIKFLYHNIMDAIDCKEKLEKKLYDDRYNDLNRVVTVEVTNSKVYVVNVKLWVAQDNTSENWGSGRREMSSL